MKKYITKTIDLLLNWEKGSRDKEDLVSSFYSTLEVERKKRIQQRFMDVRTYIVDIEDPEKFLQTFLDSFKKRDISKICIYFLENDKRFENTDTINNYINYKPYPSYLICYIYTLLFILPRGYRNRKLFESFWENQAKLRPGLNEQFTEKFLDPFIEEGITTVQEIRELCIKDWLRWQRSPKDSPYYGAPLGPSIWYFPGYSSWDNIEKKLEQQWREDTGKEPKKWGE